MGENLSFGNGLTEKLRAAFPPHELTYTVITDTVNSRGERWMTVKAALTLEQVEERLDQVAPGWTWELVKVEPVNVASRKRGQEGREVRAFYAHGRLNVAGITRDGVGLDPDPRAAATMAFKNAAARFGIGRYLNGPEYRVNVPVADEVTARKIVAKRLTWEEVCELARARTKPKPAPNLPEEDIPF